MTARLAPDNSLLAARVLWSYLHCAVSLRLAWPTREGLDPDEVFTAGIEALGAWLADGVGGEQAG